MFTRFSSAPLYVLLALTAFVTTSYAAAATIPVTHHLPRGDATTTVTAVAEAVTS
ncbi:uncharacterized protein F5147DRAFT_773448 [Suillus discolor]|uniref:Uncharacterized protein n=1 Tax=Suillus discolor TaxID=1912936 RepID=A0A9P7F761_9AGAM|nr:uncharacterized protein F5147DRAFT_773448 [Suillus discolor]KAG2108657.1 hypothetical protein F5147DRAFT_773448 [Suillus discolor]